MTRDLVLFVGLESCLDAVQCALGHAYNVKRVDPDRATVARELGRAVGLIDGSIKVRLDQQLLSYGNSLLAVVTASTGIDHIDTDYLSKSGIALASLRSEKEFLESLTSTPELAWGLLLACVRNIPAAHRSVLEGGWDRMAFQGRMLHGRTLGLVGLGRIGRILARYGEAFGMRILACDPAATQAQHYVEMVALETLLSTADIISIQVHLAPDTRHMLGEREFGMMKRGAVFINVARGGLVDEDALIEALKNGTIASAGVDVLADEPEIGASRLAIYARSAANLVITPHIGGTCEDALVAACGRAGTLMKQLLDRSAGGSS